MKILKFSVVLFVISYLVSCGEDKASSKSDSSNTPSNDSGEKSTKKELSVGSWKFDLSTPYKAVESFIMSSQLKDGENLSKCFSPSCEKEFQKVAKNQMNEKDLNEFNEFCLNSSIIAEKIEGDKAIVTVRFSKREELIHLELIEGNWKIMSF